MPVAGARGALERTQAVPARWLTSVEPPLWPEGAELWQLAALADAALAPYTALSRAGVGPSDRVLVVGSDVRARFAAAIAVAKGAKLVAAAMRSTAPSSSRRNRAIGRARSIAPPPA